MEFLKPRQVGAALAIAVGAAGLGACTPSPETPRPEVFEINTVGDAPDVLPGDGVCETAEGDCTLRGAIQEANALPGLQEVNAKIQGTPRSYNEGEAVYVIKPQSPLPEITDTTKLDFSTQPGSKKNTIPAPGPLNDIKTIEIDGSDIPNHANGFVFRADDSELSGAAIYGFIDAVSLGADRVKVSDVYLGVAADGVTPKGNVGLGVGQIADGSSDLQLGGYNPADRFLIGANLGGAFSPNTGSDNWHAVGGIVGLNKDQEKKLPNASSGGSGNPSLDNSDGHLLDQMVIAGNDGHGVAPANAKNVIIRDSLIGLNYKGEPFGNVDEGITFGGDSDGSLVEGTTIAYNGNGGLAYHSGSDEGVATRVRVYGNNANGITIFDSSRVTITDSEAEDNGGSQIEFVQVFGETKDNQATNNRLRGDTAGKPNAIGVITVRSGVQRTLIENNNIKDVAGVRSISIQGLFAPEMGFAGVPSGTAVIGNNLQGIIDRNTSTDTSNPPDGLADILENVGPTPNGVENYMNKPVINNTVLNGDSLDLSFSLEAQGSDSDIYLLQVYAKIDGDYTPIGSTVTSNGNHQVNIQKPNTVLPEGVEIVATATAIVSGKPLETSEFSN